MESHVSQHATSGGLIKATLGAAAAAVAVLVLVWLPAEYGVDPTGVGKWLGLTEMGDVKQQLNAEAESDQASAQNMPDANYAAVIARLDAMQVQLDALAAGSAAPSTAKSLGPGEWRDQVEYALEPGEGIEVKLVMNKDAVAEYAWNANGSVLNHDTHGDGNGQDISYKQGRAVSEDSGEITAAFTGFHGWFWRNRTEDTVTVTLTTRGEYNAMALP